jgi:hypothetical protein
MDVEEVKRAAKSMESIAAAQVEAKLRAMTPAEVEQIPADVRQANAEKIGHHVPVSNCEPMTATKVKDSFKLKLSHGPTGGESTPPFGDVVHRGVDGAVREEPFGGGRITKNERLNPVLYWKGVADALKEEIKRLDGCIISWRDREEYLMAQACEIRAALADAEKDLHELRRDPDETEIVELSGEAVDTLCEMSLKTLLEEAAKVKPVLTDYPHNPTHSYASAWGRAQTEKIDREILAQKDAMREQQADFELTVAIDKWRALAEEGTDEDHGDGEVYGRGPALEGERVTQGFADETEDLVNSPTHYNQFGLECIDAIKLAVGEEGFVGYCHGNALKYLWRAEYKHSKRQDLAKAAWYCRMATGDDPRE